MFFRISEIEIIMDDVTNEIRVSHYDFGKDMAPAVKQAIAAACADARGRLRRDVKPELEAMATRRFASRMKSEAAVYQLMNRAE